MAQGSSKFKNKPKKNKKKGAPVTKRANAPMKPKKQKLQEVQKLKQVISKTLNKAVEAEIRSKVGRPNLKLSNVQEAVANYNTKGALKDS